MELVLENAHLLSNFEVYSLLLEAKRNRFLLFCVILSVADVTWLIFLFSAKQPDGQLNTNLKTVSFTVPCFFFVILYGILV